MSCHLGAGASLCAIDRGRSVDTTMGFTPFEGLVMATRSGSVDPGLLLWLLERTGMAERDLAYTLEHESGLLGLAGSADMRDVLSRSASGDPEAQNALDVYSHRLRAAIAAMVASLGRSQERARRPERLSCAREDVEIARQARAVLGEGSLS